MPRRRLLQSMGEAAPVSSGPPYTFAFGQSDGSLLESISPWSRNAGFSDLTVQSSQLAQTGTGAAAATSIWALPAMASADSYAQARWKTVTNRTSNYVAARLKAGNTFVGVRRGGNNFQLVQYLAGVATVLGTYAAAVNDLVRLEVADATARVLVNGVERIAPVTIDASLTTPVCGIVLTNASVVVNPWLDDFEVGLL